MLQFLLFGIVAFAGTLASPRSPSSNAGCSPLGPPVQIGSCDINVNRGVEIRYFLPRRVPSTLMFVVRDATTYERIPAPPPVDPYGWSKLAFPSTLCKGSEGAMRVYELYVEQDPQQDPQVEPQRGDYGEKIVGTPLTFDMGPIRIHCNDGFR